jgi:hypothetical protein
MPAFLRPAHGNLGQLGEGARARRGHQVSPARRPRLEHQHAAAHADRTQHADASRDPGAQPGARGARARGRIRRTPAVGLCVSHPVDWLQDMSRTPCSICGTKHEAHQGHVFPREDRSSSSAIAREVDRAVEAVANARTRDAARVANGVANTTGESLTYRHRDVEKRRAYMRELMTKRRAARRAARAAGKAA